MMKNRQTLPKQTVVRNLQTRKAPKFEVWNLATDRDKKDLIQELDKMMRSSSLSIILVEGDR